MVLHSAVGIRKFISQVYPNFFLGAIGIGRKLLILRCETRGRRLDEFEFLKKQFIQ